MIERNFAPQTILFALGLLITTAAQAQNANHRGWAVSAGIGVSKIEDQDGNDTFSGSGLGLSAEVEYRFTPHFALGTGFFSLGETDDTFGTIDTTISVRGMDLFGRLILPVSDTVDIYGRIGSAVYFVDIDPGGVSLADAFGEDAVELGLGIDFARRENLAYRLEGRFFNGGKDETGTLFTVGVNYLF